MTQHLPPSDEDEDAQSFEQTTKRKRSHNATAEKPVSDLLHRRKVPTSFEDADEADLMMWEWKNQGRSWNDITQRWSEITGQLPRASSLAVRYIKIAQKLARAGKGNVSYPAPVQPSSPPQVSM